MEADRLPPHATEAERGLLGCLLLSPESTVADLLDVEPEPLRLLYDLRHRRLAEIILEMSTAGRLVDTVTVGQRLHDLKAEQEVGGPEYWIGHQDCTPSPANLPHYVEVLRESHLRRWLMELGVKLTTAGRDDPDIASAVEMAEQEVFALTSTGTNGNGASTKEAVQAMLAKFEDAHANRGQPRGLATGIYDLDRLIRGMRPGQLIVIGARPSEGKSALAGQIAERAAVLDRVPTGFFSLEMSKDEVVSRMVCSNARVPLDRAEDGELTEGEKKSICRASAAVAGAPLHVYDRGGLSIGTLRTMARRAHRKHGLGIVIVDYCQLMHGDIRRKDSRTLEIGEITSGLKSMAKELGLPVVLLSQLNRDYDKDRRREPRLSDLRDSGTIEQDADAVILIHPEQSSDRAPPDLQPAKLLVRKNRNGRTGPARVTFNRPLIRFDSVAPGA